MKKIVLLMVLLLSGPTSVLAAAQHPHCVRSLEAMPESWRSSAELQKSLGDEPWLERESKDAQHALEAGIDEMLELYATRPAAVTKLWDDAVESLIDVTYSGGTGSAAVDEKAREGAYRNLGILMAPYLAGDPRATRCKDFRVLLHLAIYAHRFYAPGDVRTAKIVAFANAAYRECDSFAAAVGNNYQGMLENEKLVTEDVFQLVIWSIQLIDAELVPGLDLPIEARTFSPTLWRYLESYPLPGAHAYSEGAWSRTFNNTGYLATHIAFIPTGYHRYPIYVEDSLKLYRFFRENFYPVLDMGELDLAAEFVDALRQYGCTEENDRQVRDGTRYLLKVFRDNHDRWMRYREPGQKDVDLDDYDLIHKAWSATIGLRRRVPEQPAPGTYGGVVRKWLPTPD